MNYLYIMNLNLYNYNPYYIIRKYINDFDEEYILKNIDYFGQEDYYIYIIIMLKINISEKFIVNICGDDAYKYNRLRCYLERKNINAKSTLINLKVLDHIYGYVKDLNYDSKKLLI
jgi:hypothetical protein